MSQREETARVREARLQLEKRTANLKVMVKDGIPSHQRRSAELNVEQAQKELEWALTGQEAVHRLADEHDAEVAQVAADRSAKIKTEYFLDHPEITESQYEQLRPEVEARFNAASRQAAKASTRRLHSGYTRLI